MYNGRLGRRNVVNVSEDMRNRVKDAVLKSGMWQAGYVNKQSLKYYQEIRDICRSNACRHYGASWACPPAVGTLNECRARVDQYDNFLLFSQKYALEDSFGIEGMQRRMLAFKDSVDVLDDMIKSMLPRRLILSNEGCARCAKCTYPNMPCRFPERLYHSIEGYGFNASELAEAAGIMYNNGVNTVTFLGGLLF